MAGLIDVGILKPELASSFATGYNQSEERRNSLAQQQQQSEMNQFKLDQLKQERQVMLQFQEQMKAAGKDPDLGKLFDSMIATGKPEYVTKGIEGKQKLKEQLEFAKIVGGGEMTAPEIPAAAASVMRMPQAPSPVNTLGSGTFGMGETTAPVNAMANRAPAAAVAPAASVNALAAGPDQAMVAQTQKRISDLMRFAASNPGMANQAMAQARIMQDQLELYSKRGPAESADVQTMRALGIPLTPEGYQQFTGAKRPDRLRTPEEEAQAIRIAAAGRAPGASITMVSEKAEQGARGKMLVDQYSDISKSAGLAIKTLPSIEANLTSLNKGLDTGFGTEAKAAGAKILGALGVKDAEKYATDTQTFQANAINAVLQKQLEQKGPQTESDARRIEQIGAQLGKTKAANEFILSMAKEQLRRDVDQRNFYDRWYKTNKTYDGAEDAWFAGEGGKSLFDRPGLKQYSVSAANQIPTAATPARAAPAARTVVRTGTLNGRRVIQYSDGSTEYGN